ncbi:hypothetical protein KC343_g7513 [Hortaea werneckii]|nr:hypothetical protein KC323_g7871 [Hortaea werneckii]KAI6867171.1 hypothetical protein KC338_g4496 [Hortaea werneckii]KAI7178276.1 hypothetical protein KC352_g23921 [Hortaea werneckii]KAI7351026.1 hypothetical protein KC320_g5196 [Hortaea werneckii]KAI7563266.1 hypothetical protein KC317_g7847 [Hortaea werneckii]
MGFHGLTFSQAKAIDIFFDLVIGRGSQVLVALAVYPLLRRAVLRSMEVREFSLTLVLPFFMERLSAFTLWAMLTNMRVTKKRDSSSDARIAKSRIRIDWRIVVVVLVGCYILSIPTFLSAMTSYQARGEPFFPVDGDSNYMSADDVKYPNVFVQHGDQLGLGASSGKSSFDFPLYNATDPELYAACVGYYEARFGQVEELWRQNWYRYYRAYPSALDMAYTYKHNPASQSDEAFKDKLMKAKLAFDKTRDSLPLRQSITDQHKPPSWSFTLWPRNVTWGEDLHLMDESDYMNSAIRVRNTTYDLETPVDLLTNSNRPRIPDSHESDTFDGIPLRFKYSPDPDSTTYFAMKDGDTVLYRGSELATKGKCLPSKDYVWGFSSLMLFTFCMLTIIIVLLLIVLHYDAYCNSMADRYKLQISAFRDVLDLAEELRARYGEAEVASMSAPELDTAMQTDPAMIGLDTATLRNPRAARWKQGSLRLRLPKWGKRRKASGVAGSSTSDAEESLMSIGLDKHESGFGLGNMPSKAVTRQST